MYIFINVGVIAYWKPLKQNQLKSNYCYIDDCNDAAAIMEANGEASSIIQVTGCNIFLLNV